jgi:hypothetical protein
VKQPRRRCRKWQALGDQVGNVIFNDILGPVAHYGTRERRPAPISAKVP